MQRICEASTASADQVALLAESLVARSACQHKRGSYIEALSDAQHAVARAPNSYKPYLRKGYAICLSLGVHLHLL